MKRTILLCALCFQTALAEPANDVETLRRQVEELAATVRELKEQIQQQEVRWNGYSAPAVSAMGDLKESRDDEIAASTEDAETVVQQTRPGIFNPEISAAVDFITSYSNAADNWNFTLRDVEVLFAADIDPYARAYVVFNAETELEPEERLGVFEETEIKLEEAAIVTTSLPYGLVVKGGQFFADFTRLGRVHSHDLPFVDRPLSLERIIGGETKARGIEINWLLPIAHYVRLTGGIVDNIGAEEPVTSSLLLLDDEETNLFAENEHRPFDSLMFYGRAATQFEIGASTLLRLAGNYGQRPDDPERQIASADMKLEWRPDPARFDLLEVGAEALWSRESGRFSDDALFLSRSGSSRAYGGYAYAQYRFGQFIQPGIRFDSLRSTPFEQLDRDDDGEADFVRRTEEKIYALSGYLTLYASEFNRLRLQLSYLWSDSEIVAGQDDDIRLFLQWTALLGPHKHEFEP